MPPEPRGAARDRRRLSRGQAKGGKGFENLAPERGKGFEKPHSRGGKGFEKVVRKGSLGFENRQYAELCSSYHEIDAFRSKLLAALPIASAGGLFLLLSDRLGEVEQMDAVKPFLIPIGIFGTVVTFGLFCYEVYGIRKCGALIATGQRLEKTLGVEGQFTSRPNDFINEPFAAGVIYPAVLAAWVFLALYASDNADAARIGSAVFIVGLAAMLIWDVRLVMGCRKPAASIGDSTRTTQSR